MFELPSKEGETSLLLVKIRQVKNIFLLLSFLIVSGSISAQALEPVSWESSVVVDENGDHRLVFEATMDKNWVIYSQHTKPDGPIPTEFEIETEGIELIGEVEELTKPKTEMSKMFEMEVSKFSNSATFSQKFKPSGAKIIRASVTFMTCDNLRCIPPTTVDFEVEL